MVSSTGDSKRGRVGVCLLVRGVFSLSMKMFSPGNVVINLNQPFIQTKQHTQTNEIGNKQNRQPNVQRSKTLQAR